MDPAARRVPKLTKQSFHARLWSKLLRFDRSLGLIRPGDRILAAVSGGPDSVCLAHFLFLLAQRRRFEIRLIHFHHGLRGKAADRDARFVDRLAARWSQKAIQRRLPVAAFARSSGRSMEDAGRQLRYDGLLREARRLRCNKAATAHHLDDQAETVLLNLLRGTRARGLAGIPPRRPLGGEVEVIRPLLALRREEILQYLRHHRLKFRIDASNRSVDFTRNWIRLRVLPLLERKNPRIREHLAAIADDLRELLDKNSSSRRTP